MKRMQIKPKNEQFNKFIKEAEDECYATLQKYQEEVSPDDSVSVVAAPVKDEPVLHVPQSTATDHSSRPARLGSSRSSRPSRSSPFSRSSISSVRQKEQAEHAALLAQAASLKQKEALELAKAKAKAKVTGISETRK